MPQSGPFRPLALAAGLTAGLLLVPGHVQAETPDVLAPGTVGAYLAGREASARSDYASSPAFLERLLENDGENAAVLNTLLLNRVVLGHQDRAVDLATRLLELDPANDAAKLVLIADAFARQDYARGLALSANSPTGNDLVDGLTPAWAHLGLGSMTEALDTLEALAEADGMAAFALYCRALALALVGDVEGALAVIEDPDLGVGAVLNRRGIIAHAQLLALAERQDAALALIDEIFAEPERDRRLIQMIAAYEQGNAVPFDVIATPAEGMAEVFAALGSVMRSARNPHDGLMFARMALWLNPSLSETRLLVGQFFEDLEQPELAAQAYAEVPEDDFFGMAAAMGQAQTLFTLERTDEAIAVLEGLTRAYPDSAATYHVLGDFLRFAARSEAAVDAYDRAVELLREQGRMPDWRLMHARALMNQRLDRWEQAEADFRAALEDQPNQATILNNFAYSMVERQENLDEALEMIRRAVAAEPESGYFVDSLAWALFRMGRYDEALPHMERAVELLPGDPILNDHLGDVYWSVGRYREARFQWRRALSFGPHDELDADRVRRKLEVGLYQVLAEEDAPPLHAAD